jgi:hypothetical protein
MVCCSVCSAVGFGASATTPSMLSAMAAVMVCEMCVGAREVQVDGRGGRRLLLVDAEGDGGGCGLGRQARWSCECCWCLTSALDRQEPPTQTPIDALLTLPKHTRAPRLPSALTLTPQMSVMTLLDNHLEQISLCAASIAELQYASPMSAAVCSSDPRPALPRPRYSPMRCCRTMISPV